MSYINQPATDRSLIGKISNPLDGRKDDENTLFCTGNVHIIGVHQGFTIGTYSNKDGSGGLFITNGSSCFNIDDNRNIHIQTGKSAEDGASGGQIILRSDGYVEKSKSVKIEVSGTDDETTTNKSGDGESRTPAYSLEVYGNIDIVSKGGDIKFAADNILLDAKEQVKIKSGQQTQIFSGDGVGKIDFVAGEVTTTSKFAKFDLTSSFYVNGPEEISFNQKIKVNPLENQIQLNSFGATNAINSIGGKNSVIVGSEKIVSTGNLQLQGYKTLFGSIGGTADVSIGPSVDYTLGQYEGIFTGIPRENSRSLAAYTLSVGGAAGVSYNLNAGGVDINSLGPANVTSVSLVDIIGSLILLN